MIKIEVEKNGWDDGKGRCGRGGGMMEEDVVEEWVG